MKPAALTPAPLPDFDPAAIVDLDVRDELRAGREPLAAIRSAAASLPTGGVLHLRSPFQPTPLFTVLTRLGFEFHTESFADDDWSSWFWRDEMLPKSPVVPDTMTQDVDGAWDLRNLPPPEPLRLVLERIAGTSSAFEVLLPAYSDMLVGMLAGHRWDVDVITMSASGARIRFTPISE